MRIFAIPNEGNQHNRGVAQLASASGLGPEGPVFESQYPDFKRSYLISGGFFFLFIRHEHTLTGASLYNGWIEDYLQKYVFGIYFETQTPKHTPPPERVYH